jgi:hypothetical protein
VTVALPTTTTPNVNTTNSIIFLIRRALSGHGFTITINNIRETVTTRSAIARSLGYDKKRERKSFLGTGIKKRGDSITALTGIARVAKTLVINNYSH